MIILTKIKSINWQGIRENKIYQRFASLKTSCIFLGILIGFYIVGTIFPQGAGLDDYIQSGGGFTSIVIFFDLLNIFNTPGFLIATFLLFINLTICVFERFLILLSERKIAAEEVQFIPQFILPLDISPQLGDTRKIIKDIFKKEFGFTEKTLISRAIKPGFPQGINILEKGWSYRWLTWGYHVAILFCFFGFLMTYMFAFEGEITLYPGEAATIKPAAINRWDKNSGHKHKKLDFKIMLDEFITEYNQFPQLDYPADKFSRLAIAMGWKDPKYLLKGEAYAPKDWKSRLKVMKGNQVVLEKTIEVNNPLSYQGITFYQAAYKQTLQVQIDDNPISFETDTDSELIIPGVDGMLKFDTIRTGTLFKKDGRTEKINAFTEVSLIKKDRNGKTETEKLGRLEHDGGMYIGDKMISLREFKEASVLSYRYDPGVAILWWSGVSLLIAMTLRVFGAWYRIMYRLGKKGGASYLLLTVKTKGLMANEERLIKMLKHSLVERTEPIDLIESV